MHALLNRLTARSGQRDRVIELLVESGKAFDRNQACLLYLVNESVEEPDVIWVFDLWTSVDEHKQALARPELRPFIDEAIPLLTGMPEQMELRLVGGKAP